MSNCIDCIYHRCIDLEHRCNNQTILDLFENQVTGIPEFVECQEVRDMWNYASSEPTVSCPHYNMPVMNDVSKYEVIDKKDNEKV